ncbi:MAG: metallopeptidase family protein [Deltaproteobacteria bacterium]|nr:metallopeptidase family protein [Deltaproteobacteria bacterium]
MDQAQREELLDQGYASLDGDDPATAYEIAQRLVSADRRDAEAYRLQGEALLVQDRADEALAVIERGLERCRNDPTLLASRASILLDVFDDPLGAARDLERASVKGADPAFAADVDLMYADACLRLQQPKAALAAAERAAAAVPEAPDPHHLQAQALFDLLRFDDALDAVARAIDRDPRFAAAYHLRGEILTFVDDGAAARKAFERARRLDPEAFFEPPRIDEGEFERIVAEAIDALPPQVADYLHNVAVVVEARPSVELLRASDPPLTPACLGMFDGTPRPDERTDDPWSQLPRAVRLFRDNILLQCRDRADVVEVVSTTLLHEVGHFLGLDEEDLVERGLH